MAMAAADHDISDESILAEIETETWMVHEPVRAGSFPSLDSPATTDGKDGEDLPLMSDIFGAAAIDLRADFEGSGGGGGVELLTRPQSTTSIYSLEDASSSDLSGAEEEGQQEERQEEHLNDLVCNLTGNESEEECARRFLEYQTLTHRVHKAASAARKRARDRIRRGLAPRNPTALAAKMRRPRRQFHWRIKLSQAYQSRKSTARSRNSRARRAVVGPAPPAPE